jgi:serine O-acetyltransferase
MNLPHQFGIIMGKQDVLSGSCRTETITADRVRNPIP